MEDYQDLMLGLDEVIHRTARWTTDAARVAGGSYGGFMTNWILGHTTRFRVAETDRSIINWFSWYGSSDAQGLTDWEFNGPPVGAGLDLHGPVTPALRQPHPHAAAHRAQRGGLSRAITDAEQLYMNLRRRRVPVESCANPRSYHGLSRTGPPWLLVDRLERIRTWFDHWMTTDMTTTSSR